MSFHSLRPPRLWRVQRYIRHVKYVIAVLFALLVAWIVFVFCISLSSVDSLGKGESARPLLQLDTTAPPSKPASSTGTPSPKTSAPTLASSSTHAETVMVRSVAELREQCRARAPTLYANGSRIAWGADKVLQLKTDFFYTLVDAPLCFDPLGHLLLDLPSSQHPDMLLRLRSALEMKTVGRVERLTDVFFLRSPGVVRLVPAVAAMGWGRFIGSHLSHMLGEVLVTALHFYSRYRDGLLMRLPVQAVIVDGHVMQWYRGGSSELTRAAFNILSHPGTDAAEQLPLLDTAPLYFFGETTGKRAAGMHPTDFPACFCAGVTMKDFGSWSHLHPTESFRRVAEWAPRQFLGVPARRRAREAAQATDHSGAAFAADDTPQQWARMYWNESAVSSRDGSYRPKALFFRRNSRRIANEEALFKLAREELDFRVVAIYPDKLSPALQYYLSSTADIMLGIHGLALTNAVWMARLPRGEGPEDGYPRPPRGCRKEMVELAAWVDDNNISPFVDSAKLSGVLTTRLRPSDVFYPGVRDQAAEKRKWMQPNAFVRYLMWMKPVWWEQVVTHSEAVVGETLRSARERLQSCRTE